MRNICCHVLVCFVLVGYVQGLVSTKESKDQFHRRRKRRTATEQKRELQAIISFEDPSMKMTTTGQKIPRFENANLVGDDYFLITCADNGTLDWLIELELTDFETILDNKTYKYPLKIRRWTDLLTPVKTVLTFIPNSGLSEKIILERLARQNAQLNPWAWKIEKNMKGAEGQMLTLVIDQSSYDTLGNKTQLNCRAYFELGTVYFWQTNNSNAQRQQATAAEDKDCDCFKMQFNCDKK